MVVAAVQWGALDPGDDRFVGWRGSAWQAGKRQLPHGMGPGFERQSRRGPGHAVRPQLAKIGAGISRHAVSGGMETRQSRTQQQSLCRECECVLLASGTAFGDRIGDYVLAAAGRPAARRADRKSTRLNSSHLGISYAVFCLKKKTRFRVGPRFGCNTAPM